MYRLNLFERDGDRVVDLIHLHYRSLQLCP